MLRFVSRRRWRHRGKRAFPPGSGALILAGSCSPCSSSNQLILVVHMASRAPSSRCAEASPTSGSCSVDNFPAPRSCMVVGSTWQANGFSQCPSTNWEGPPSLCDSFPWHLKVQISTTFYQHGSSEISLHPINHSYVHPNKVQISAGDGVWRDRPWGVLSPPEGWCLLLPCVLPYSLASLYFLLTNPLFNFPVTLNHSFYQTSHIQMTT